MKIVILGAAGFIGTNLAFALSGQEDKEITLVDERIDYFDPQLRNFYPNIHCVEAGLTNPEELRRVITGQDVVYHLISTTMPTNSNLFVPQELEANVVLTSHLLDHCVHERIRKVVFISSGGTVYGKESKCPITEDAPTYPISSYGLQKITIEKLLYLYHHMHGLDYRVVRLANPYGPYQRPNGKLGAITTFIYRALTGQEIQIYGDGSVVRDYIYIDDAIRGILNISESDDRYRTYNLGSGHGTSSRQVIDIIRETLGIDPQISYLEGRSADVAENYLDISRYESIFGKLNPLPLQEGIKKAAAFLEQQINEKTEKTIHD